MSVWSHIVVSVNNGIVTLSGHVPTHGEKYGAEKAPKRVFGVEAVANELDVELASDMRITDEDIARNCQDALRAHFSLPDQKLELVVNSTVEGTVATSRPATARSSSADRYARGPRRQKRCRPRGPRPSVENDLVVVF